MGLMKLLSMRRTEVRSSGPGRTPRVTTAGSETTRQFSFQFDGHDPMSDLPIKPIDSGATYDFDGKDTIIKQFGYQNGISRLCPCDSQSGLVSIRHSSVDLVLTDPPYAIAKGQRLTKVGAKIQTEVTKYQHYDEFTEGQFERLMEVWINQFERILKPGGFLVVFCGKEWIWLIQLLAAKKGLEFKDMIIAQKLAPQPALAQKMLRSCYETALWFFKPPLKEAHFNQQNQDVCVNLATWNFLNHRQTKHPNEKPLPLMRWCVETFSNEGDLVVDAFGGSGVTGEACIHTKRRSILFEMNPGYWAEEKDRLTTMLPMFGGSEQSSLPGFNGASVPDQEPTDTEAVPASEPPPRPDTPAQKVDEPVIDWW